MLEIQKYKQQSHYPVFDTITEVARHKCPSLRDMEIRNKITRVELKQMVAIAIIQYISDDLLPLSPAHINMISNWVVADYNPETQQGGAMGYSIEDIHIIFRMGISGQFGKPSGHKYVLPEITGKKGWFEQYEEIRNVELGSYYYNLNKKKATYITKPSATAILCPEDLKIDNSIIANTERKQYKSIQEFCDDKGYDIDVEMKPYIEHWTHEFQRVNPKGLTLQDYISYERIKMLKRINNAPLKAKGKKETRKYENYKAPKTESR